MILCGKESVLLSKAVLTGDGLLRTFARLEIRLGDAQGVVGVQVKQNRRSSSPEYADGKEDWEGSAQA